MSIAHCWYEHIITYFLCRSDTTSFSFIYQFITDKSLTKVLRYSFYVHITWALEYIQFYNVVFTSIHDCVDRAMSVLCKPTWKTKRLHTELDTDFLLTSRFSDVITHTFLLWTTWRLSMYVKNSIHWHFTGREHESHKNVLQVGTGLQLSMGITSPIVQRAMIGQWKIVVTECMFCEWKMNHLVLHVRSFGYVFNWWNNWISKIQNYKLYSIKHKNA